MFYTGLGNVESIRKADGNINWSALSRSIGTKSVKEVKDFAMNFNALESGTTYEEFGSKAAVDVWRQLAGNLTWPGNFIKVNSVFNLPYNIFMLNKMLIINKYD